MFNLARDSCQRFLVPSDVEMEFSIAEEDKICERDTVHMNFGLND
jgi:hypothetical protein